MPPPIRVSTIASPSLVTLSIPIFSLAQSRLEGEFCRDVPEGILVVQLLADQHAIVAHSAAQFGACDGHRPCLCCFGDGFSLSRPQPSVC